METSQLSLLKTRRFLPLFISQFLGAFNDNAFKNALAILITYRIVAIGGMDSQILVTLAAGLFIFPFFLFSATAGQLADKYEKAHLIVMIKFAEVVLVMFVAMGFYLKNIPMLMFVLFLLGVQAAFFGPLKYAILPDQLGENELIAGNGLIEAGTFIAILLGTILGGVLILHVWGAWLISIMMGFFAIAGFLISFYIPKTQHKNPNLRVSYNFIIETFRVVQYSAEQGKIFLCILAISWFWLIGAIFVAEFPVFTKNILYANEYVVTFFFSLFSIGIAIGSLLCNWLLKGKVHGTYVPLAALGITLFTIDLYFAAGHIGYSIDQLATLEQFFGSLNAWRITIDLLLVSACGGIYTVPLYAMLQRYSSAAHRARVIASNNIVNALFMVLATVGTMIMLNAGLSVSQVFLVVAILNGFFAIYIFKRL